MSNNHLYARRKSDGDKVFIDDIPNGKKCGCICSKCHEPLIAKNGGEINIHHFAHISDSNCTGETEAHFEAKEIIKREKYLWLPNYNESKKVEFDDVQVECLIKNSKYRADLLCTAKGKEIAVEIVVTHDLDADKKSYLVQEKVTTLTIDLSRILTKEQYNNLPKNFSDMVLKTSNRRWFYNEKLDAIKAANKAKKKSNPANRVKKEKKNIYQDYNDALKEILKKKKSDKLIYGNLILADCRKYGGWQNTLCVKSDKLSPTYENLAIVEENIIKLKKDYIGVKVGFKITDEESRYDVEMPHCKVLWNKRDKDKIKKRKQYALPNFKKKNKDLIDEFQKVCGYNKNETDDYIRSIQSDPKYNRVIHIISKMKKLIEDAKA
jgi:hypothetical protein